MCVERMCSYSPLLLLAKKGPGIQGHNNCFFHEREISRQHQSLFSLMSAHMMSDNNVAR